MMTTIKTSKEINKEIKRLECLQHNAPYQQAIRLKNYIEALHWVISSNGALMEESSLSANFKDINLKGL